MDEPPYVTTKGVGVPQLWPNSSARAAIAKPIAKTPHVHLSDNILNKETIYKQPINIYSEETIK